MSSLGKTLRRFGASTLVVVLASSMTILPAAAYVANTGGAIPGPVPLSNGGDETSLPVLPREACADAESQAAMDQNATLWLLGGCVGGVLVVIAANVIEPKPPATALLGKDDAYVAEFTDCYARAAKKIRSKKAITGCLVGTGASLLLWAIIVATSDDYYTF